MTTTKEQERKALEQIRKIVDSLGEYSYVKTAFDGCFEIAEDNIENDFAFSMKNRYECLNTEHERTVNVCQEQEERIKELEKRIKELENINEREAKNAEYWRNEHGKVADSAVKNWNELREEQNKTEKLEQEIVKLKAKLYDFITK